MNRSLLVGLIVMALAFSAPGCVASDPSPAEAETRTAETGVLGCTISADKETYRVGDTPALTVRLTNLTGEDINLIGSLDASDCKWRYPHCYTEITTPYGPPDEGARCGNTNDLRVEDFVKVPPGGRFDPYQTIDGYGFFSNHLLRATNFKMAGEYRLRFVYSTAATLGSFRGDASNLQLAALFEKVPKTTVKSNEIRLKFIDAEP